MLKKKYVLFYPSILHNVKWTLAALVGCWFIFDPGLSVWTLHVLPASLPQTWVLASPVTLNWPLVWEGVLYSWEVVCWLCDERVTCSTRTSPLVRNSEDGLAFPVNYLYKQTFEWTMFSEGWSERQSTIRDWDLELLGACVALYFLSAYIWWLKCSFLLISYFSKSTCVWIVQRTKL